MTATPTVLVTGATGFTGSHVLDALSDAPVQLIAACRPSEKFPTYVVS
ncbi:MAG: NAD-dependent epimerase/dehydratase family protein [Alphaproteobacteria bacterium]